MVFNRREVIRGIAGLLGANVLEMSGLAAPMMAPQENGSMYGLIGKMTVAPGKRDEVVGLLLSGTKEMPGCLSYIVATDPADDHAIWITEVWVDKASHDASLSLPAVKATIASARPHITGFAAPTITNPVGGAGLPAGQ